MWVGGCFVYRFGAMSSGWCGWARARCRHLVYSWPGARSWVRPRKTALWEARTSVVHSPTPSPIPPRRAQQRQARLAAVEQQRRQQAGGGAELRLGEATSEESEGEGAHFRLRQGEIQEVRENSNSLI